MTNRILASLQSIVANPKVKAALVALIIAVAGAVVEALLGIVDAIGSVP